MLREALSPFDNDDLHEQLVLAKDEHLVNVPQFATESARVPSHESGSPAGVLRSSPTTHLSPKGLVKERGLSKGEES